MRTGKTEGQHDKHWNHRTGGGGDGGSFFKVAQVLCTVPVPTQLDKVRWARGMENHNGCGKERAAEGHSTHSTMYHSTYRLHLLSRVATGQWAVHSTRRNGSIHRNSYEASLRCETESDQQSPSMSRSRRESQSTRPP